MCSETHADRLLSQILEDCIVPGIANAEFLKPTPCGAWRRGGGIEPPMRVLQTLALPWGYRANVLFGLQRTSPYFITQDYGLCDFFHRAALLPALAFEDEIGFFLTQSEVTLQDAFPALDRQEFPIWTSGFVQSTLPCPLTQRIGHQSGPRRDQRGSDGSLLPV
jgi:hypothetical protein